MLLSLLPVLPDKSAPSGLAEPSEYARESSTCVLAVPHCRSEQSRCSGAARGVLNRRSKQTQGLPKNHGIIRALVQPALGVAGLSQHFGGWGSSSSPQLGEVEICYNFASQGPRCPFPDPRLGHEVAHQVLQKLNVEAVTLMDHNFTEHRLAVLSCVPWEQGHPVLRAF